jgi:hypothetical protein
MSSTATTRNRFLEKALPEPNSGCWLWTGEHRFDGYGECWAFGRREMAHRAAFREFVCDIPDGAMVIHSCDTRCCVNPDHLRLGTHRDNMDDLIKRGRGLRGSKNCNNKLTQQDVRDIRASPLSQRAVAQFYEVSQALISKIRRREHWHYVED